MNGLLFHAEWQAAPGVRDPVLAKTWARLTIRAGDAVITRVLDEQVQAERDAVYGPMFPLAEWLVENFWFITSEVPRSSALSATQAPTQLRAWMNRHNLVSAGAGSALPDLTLTADASDVVLVTWAPDAGARRNVRFVSEGRLHLPVRDVQLAVSTLVNAVLDQLDGCEFEEVARLRRDWTAVGESMRSEAGLCRQLARLGLDPYGVDDDTVDTVETTLASVPTSLAHDLLDSAEGLAGLSEAVTYASRGAEMVDEATGAAFQNPLPVIERRTETRAHDTGYGAAREFRRAVGLAQDELVPDLARLMTQHDVPVQTATLPLAVPSQRVKGLVGFSSSRTGTLVTPSARPEAIRFLLGRALGACLLRQCEDGPRLLTNALSWDQAAGRAFAAELLAPHAALAQRARSVVTSEDVRLLAQEFTVSELVISHQLENHRIATILAD